MTALFVLLVVLQVADAWSTLKALKRPGNYEANPAMKWLMDKIGVKEALLFTKVAACSVVWLGVMSLDGQGHGQLATGLLVATCALYAWVIKNNLSLLK